MSKIRVKKKRVFNPRKDPPETIKGPTFQEPEPEDLTKRPMQRSVPLPLLVGNWGGGSKGDTEEAFVEGMKAGQGHYTFHVLETGEKIGGKGGLGGTYPDLHEILDRVNDQIPLKKGNGDKISKSKILEMSNDYDNQARILGETRGVPGSAAHKSKSSRRFLVPGEKGEAVGILKTSKTPTEAFAKKFGHTLEEARRRLGEKSYIGTSKERAMLRNMDGRGGLIDRGVTLGNEPVNSVDPVALYARGRADLDMPKDSEYLKKTLDEDTKSINANQMERRLRAKVVHHLSKKGEAPTAEEVEHILKVYGINKGAIDKKVKENMMWDKEKWAVNSGPYKVYQGNIDVILDTARKIIADTRTYNPEDVKRTLVVNADRLPIENLPIDRKRRLMEYLVDTNYVNIKNAVDEQIEKHKMREGFGTEEEL